MHIKSFFFFFSFTIGELPNNVFLYNSPMVLLIKMIGYENDLENILTILQKNLF